MTWANIILVTRQSFHFKKLKNLPLNNFRWKNISLNAAVFILFQQKKKVVGPEQMRRCSQRLQAKGSSEILIE